MRDIKPGAKIIDLRDVTDRVEELREERDLDFVMEGDDAARISEWNDEEGEELKRLESLLDELRGYDGNHEWEGDWYPDVLIADHYFRDYAKDLADDIGAIDNSASWPNNHIDWDRAARELQMDYTTVEYGGTTYWYR